MKIWKYENSAQWHDHTLRDDASCTQLVTRSASQLTFRPISVDFHEFSLIFIWSSLEFSQNIRFRSIFRIFRRNYQHSRTRRVEECILAHVSIDTNRFASIRINFRVYDRLKFLKIVRNRSKRRVSWAMSICKSVPKRSSGFALAPENKVEH